jgi:DegV family protein with EDD domain
MKIKIVTDSTSDISPELAKELGIEVVPAYVRFGGDIYRDGVDLSKPGFYEMLMESTFSPLTSAATPQDFAQIYSRSLDDADGIISIHASSKISRIFNSAEKGKKMIKNKSKIEIVDSFLVSIGLGLVVVAAAKTAKAGENAQSIIGETRQAISQIHMLGFLNTMKYIVRGGRVTRSVIDLSSLFHIKPILSFQDGQVIADGLVATYSHGIDRLCKFIERVPVIRDVGIAYSTNYDRIEEMRRRLGLKFPEEKIYVEQIGAALGAHCGPDAIIVAFRQAG